MPNWCENEVRILGTPEDIKTFANETLALNEDGTYFLLFDNIIPQPADLAESATNGFATPDWWTWRVNNWGTKWELLADHQTCEVREDEIYISFNTAWAPPTPVIKSIAQDNPTLTIAHSYDEPGMDFGGYDIYQNGILDSTQEGSSRSTTWHDIAMYSI